MRGFPTGLVLVSAFAAAVPLALAGQPKTCKDWSGEQAWKPEQIDIEYVEPEDAGFSAVYESLKDRRVLEILQEFLSPVRLPNRVLIQTKQCDASDPLYQPGGPVTLCYEYVAKLEALVMKIPAEGTGPRGVSRDDARVGSFVQTALNGISHAVFDQQGTPVWGTEEDAADKLAAFLMLRFDKNTARRLMNGAAFFFEASNETWTGSDFANVKSPGVQRFYNYLCMAYGSSEVFADFADENNTKNHLLPMDRAERCRKEYLIEKLAFDRFIKPCLDQTLLEKVQTRVDWLRPPG